MGQASVPSRFLLEIPAALMEGPQLDGAGGRDTDESPLDLDLVFGARRATRFGTPIRTGGGSWRQGSGRPGAPPTGEPFRPSRDLAAKRESFDAGERSGTLVVPPNGPPPARPPRPVIPGERLYRDGDRVHHARWGDGIVVSSKLTRSDEEVIVAFKDPAVGRKTMLASLANLEVVG
jgi:hypothetical protein